MNPMLGAAIIGFLGVALGAFGAHGLEGKISDKLLENYKTGVLYHLIHAVVILALALYASSKNLSVTLGVWLFALGIILFSGSLYLMAFTGIKKLGMVTPIGGLLFLAGWIWIGLKLKM